MSRTTFTLAPDAPQTRKALAEHIEGLDTKQRWRVTTEPYAANRSAAQNQLLWRWNTEIGKYLGYTKDELHKIAKEKFAVPIFTRDDPDYASMIAAVKHVRGREMHHAADALKKQIIALTSTTNFTVAQMAEYLQQLEFFAAEKGAEITFPADLMNEAMGRRKMGVGHPGYGGQPLEPTTSPDDLDDEIGF